MGALGNRLALMADTQEPAMRDRIHAALRIGATMALARVKEIGGYDIDAGLGKASEELADRQEPAAADDGADADGRLADLLRVSNHACPP